jgi:hypothetical protein
MSTIELYRFLRHPKIRLLGVSELGFLVRLIDYANELAPDGIPDSNKWRCWAGGPNCSAYMVEKRLWPAVQNFFECTAGECRYVGPPLVASPEEMAEIAAKRRAISKIANAARWRKAVSQ